LATRFPILIWRGVIAVCDFCTGDCERPEERRI
jgi:hypothetical protein